jgi:hypothetical protein
MLGPQALAVVPSHHPEPVVFDLVAPFRTDRRAMEGRFERPHAQM